MLSSYENASTIDISEETAALKPRPLRTRPSLSERAMETLANIPSSPALRKKSSAFFDSARPGSRAESSSRPGSSLNSDGSVKQSVRPDSSLAQDEFGISNFRASTSSFKAPPTSTGTPRRASGIELPSNTPKPRATPGRNSLTASRASALPPLSDVRSPSPEKKSYAMLPPSTPKTVAARPLKPRASVNGLFKKPSLPAIGRSAKDLGVSRQASTDSVETSTNSWDGTIAPVASTNTSVDSEPAPLSVRKSSAALRDQIAKARAAKRAAVKQVSAPQSPDAIHESEATIIPSDVGFDFGMAHDDPFNSRKGADPKKRALNQRVGAARTSGKLNIAALGLKEIPMEVMKMYDMESMGGSGNWAESVDLTRVVAADNEFEALDDFMFPDSSPDSLDEDENAGQMFGGLETLDLHGNLLIGVPLGFRRLAHLTTLNLVSQMFCHLDLLIRA